MIGVIIQHCFDPDHVGTGDPAGLKYRWYWVSYWAFRGFSMRQNLVMTSFSLINMFSDFYVRITLILRGSFHIWQGESDKVNLNQHLTQCNEGLKLTKSAKLHHRHPTETFTGF